MVVSSENKFAKHAIWIVIAVLGAFSLGYVALNRGETINAMWVLVASVCIYLIGYRYYALYISNKVLGVDKTRLTPAYRHNDGLDFVPTRKSILFGHHDGAQGVLCGLCPVRSRDEHREERVFGSLVLELRPETDARRGVHQVAEVDALVGADAGKLPDGLTLGPFGQGLGAPLVGDLKGRGHILLEPLHEVAEEVRRLGFVGGLGVARSGGCKVQGSGVASKRGTEFLVRVRQAQE